MTARTPDQVDAHVGDRIRTRRRELTQSQDSLAELIGVSFQQVQKYEGGKNRVSASALVKIASAQGVPVAFYFEGLGLRADIASMSPEAAETRAWLDSEEAWAIGKYAARMSAEMRAAFRRIAAVLSLNP